MQSKNVPDEHDVELMLALEHELANEYGQLDALTMEQRRGKEILLRNMKAQFNMPAVAKERLAQQFDPNYKPDPRFDYGISKEERAKRDAARSHIINWAKMDRR